MIPVIDDIETVTSFQTSMAGKTVEWWGEDNPKRFDQLLKDPIKGKILRDNNWPDRRVIYRFNSHGFRGHEFDANQDHFCVFGDSVTFGMALEQELTYGSLLERELNINCFNLGHAGGSDSTSMRLALTFLPKLRPKFVVFQTTFAHRFEWIEQNNQSSVYGIQSAGGGATPTTRSDLYRSWIDIELNRTIHAAKNIMAVRYLCQNLSIPLIEIDIKDFFCPMEQCARDLLHPGEMSHQLQFKKILKYIK